ncbi:hypothetical protein FGD67_01575 [Colwellia sp. M166]|uniref:hypothetical protein n=1 Tax=Colwellia sp. M166 TaxID=2583805 RepID=UPI00211E8EB8|nr:hypothetical protein [Colwellia sp. M166]UUO22031.1 hypothetical protein FGD67_01575 [Colwellia sp. M166]
MKLLKTIPLLIAALSPFASNALDYTSTFADNGLITTETRTDTATGAVSVWEWLDVTVTNGLSYSNVVTDLVDGILGNTSAHTGASAGAISDICALSAAQATSWQTVTIEKISEMFSAFYGEDLYPLTYQFGHHAADKVSPFI